MSNERMRNRQVRRVFADRSFRLRLTSVPFSGEIEFVQFLELLGETLAPDGTDMKLTRRGNEYIILANGKSLMSSRMHGSEEALATFGCRRVRTLEQPCVLVGGLGMDFTL